MLGILSFMWNLNCLMLYVCGGGALATVHIWKSARLLGVDSSSAMWVQGLNSGSQIWWQVFLLRQPLCIDFG